MHPHPIISSLLDDPKVREAKKMLLEALQERQKEITSIRPPVKDLQTSYNELLKQIGSNRGQDLWFPYIGSGLGRGPLVELLDGSVKYDFISGIGVYHFGHGHPKIVSSAIDASLSDLVWQGNLQQNKDQVELIAKLVKLSGLDHVFLTTSGAMAVENGLKIAFQKNAPASRVLAVSGCFTGRTLATSTISDKPAYREGLPITLGVDYVPFFDPNNAEKSIELAKSTLLSHLKRYPGQHAIMLFEMIQGEGGFYPGSSAYFRALMEILKEKGIAILVDEVQTFGRTSKAFAFQHFGLQDLVEIVTIGKLSHVCATLFTSRFKPKPGLLSQTFTASTSAIHAANVILTLLQEENFFGENGKNMQIGRYFSKKMEEMAKRNPHLVKGPWGVGAMCAFTPLDGTQEKAVKAVHALFNNGVMSFIAGANPTRIRFLMPAGVVTFEQIDHVLSIVEETLKCM